MGSFVARKTIGSARRERTRIEVTASNAVSGIIIPAHVSQNNLKQFKPIILTSVSFGIYLNFSTFFFLILKKESLTLV